MTDHQFFTVPTQPYAQLSRLCQRSHQGNRLGGLCDDRGSWCGLDTESLPSMIPAKDSRRFASAPLAIIINWCKPGMRSHKSGPGFLCDALAIVRYHHLSAEYACPLGKCQVVGYSVEVAVLLALLQANCLEQESFPLAVHIQHDHLPLTQSHFSLPKLKPVPFVQAP
jgi:hypothetical protein